MRRRRSDAFGRCIVGGDRASEVGHLLVRGGIRLLDFDLSKPLAETAHGLLWAAALEARVLSLAGDDSHICRR